GTRRHRPALHGRAPVAGRLLGSPWQGGGVLATGWPYLLPDHRTPGVLAAAEPVRLVRRRVAAGGTGTRNRRSHGRTADAARLRAPEECSVGNHRAQPRTELRAEPAD